MVELFRLAALPFLIRVNFVFLSKLHLYQQVREIVLNIATILLAFLFLSLQVSAKQSNYKYCSRKRKTFLRDFQRNCSFHLWEKRWKAWGNDEFCVLFVKKYHLFELFR